MINTHYHEPLKVWLAYLTDEHGQLGDAVSGATLELACYHLGCEMGRNPRKFTRDMAVHMKAYDRELKL